MIEIRIHGRGGQGAVIASKVLAYAVFAEGKWVQSFPAFGVERRGAPVTAFTRVDDEPILLRCEIYEPDHLMVLDPTLLNTVDVTGGLKKNGLVLINTEHGPDEFRTLGPFQIATVDASTIAIEHQLGTSEQPIVNTAILGAYAKASGLVSLNAVSEAIRQSMPAELQAEANAAAARQAYERVLHAPSRDVAVSAP